MKIELRPIPLLVRDSRFNPRRQASPLFFFRVTGPDIVARLRVGVRPELLGIEAGAGYE